MALVDVRHGDSIEAMRALPAGSVDAVVTDPPYGLDFMGNGWDRFTPAAFQEFSRAWAAEALRILRPGGHLLAFGGTRTAHRLTAGIEDAGFEIRDSITWLYGSGFPKSLDVGKAIDKAAGATRAVVGPSPFGLRAANGSAGVTSVGLSGAPGHDITAPATDAARRWNGWGTALKPASEPIIVARKPLAGTVAANVLAYGAGALNIDGCRVPASGRPLIESASRVSVSAYGDGLNGSRLAGKTDEGRWPANVVITHAATPDGADLCADGCVSGCPVADLDAQSGFRPGGVFPGGHNTPPGATNGTMSGGWSGSVAPARRMDSGGASRFFPTFRYQAKAPTRERPRVDGIAHPTVKPLTLMQWLVRLVTPPDGTVLDPFAGSGTTAEACAIEGYGCIAIEREATYLPLIEARLARVAQGDGPCRELSACAPDQAAPPSSTAGAAPTASVTQTGHEARDNSEATTPSTTAYAHDGHPSLLPYGCTATLPCASS